MGNKLAESVHDDGSHYSWIFLCPACRAPHQCDTRWTFNGDRERPTFGGSVLVYEVKEIHQPRCHSIVRDGRIEYCNDSTHAFAGKTEDLPDWPGWHEALKDEV